MGADNRHREGVRGESSKKARERWRGRKNLKELGRQGREKKEQTARKGATGKTHQTDTGCGQG